MFCINHAYAASNGGATMFIRPLYWQDGWPQFQYVATVQTAASKKVTSITKITRPQIILQADRQKTSLIATDGKEYYSINGANIKMNKIITGTLMND
jgi:hypothetical protein